MFVYLENADEQTFILVENVGRWVFTQQGPIGERAAFSSIETEDAAGARATAQLLVAQAGKGGFVRVDGGPAPRVLLVDGRNESFVWFQIKDTMLLEASGALNELADCVPRATFTSSDEEADALRGDKVHALAADGYNVVFFGHGPLSAARPKKKAAKPRGTIAPLPPELRAAVLDDPDNADRWAAIRDWVEEHRPRLHHFLEAERQGQPIDVHALAASDAKALFGPTHAAIVVAIKGQPVWRAGHLAACELDLRAARFRDSPFTSPTRHLAEMTVAPAFACLHALDVTGISARELATITPLAPQLRSLRISTGSFPWKDVPARWFAGCTRLQALTLGIVEEGTIRNDSFEHLQHLALESERPLSVLAMPLGGLRSLVIDLRLCVGVDDFVRVLDQIATSAPNVSWFSVNLGAGWHDGSQSSVFFAALERSRLRPQLRHVYVRTGEEVCRLVAPQLATWRGGAFGHLESLELSHRYARYTGAVD